MIEQQELTDEGLTVGEYLHQWLAHARGRVRASTYCGYEALIRRHAVPGLGAVPLTAVGPLSLQRLYARLLAPQGELSAGTVLNLHLVLTNALGQAVRWNLLSVNPASGAQPPRPRRPEIPLVDQALVTRILAAAQGSRLELPVAMAVATGMRRGEILALRWADLDSEFAVAHVRRTVQPIGATLVFSEPKTRRSRRAVALPRFIRPYLERQRDSQAVRRARLGAAWCEHDLLVDSGDGSPLNPGTLSSGWAKFLREKRLPHIRFHDLRHGHATLMLLQGVHPKVVSERLGHASVGITLDTYSHVLPSMQTEAAQAIDDLFAS